MLSLSDIRRAVVSRYLPSVGALLGSVLFALAIVEPHGLRWAGVGVAVLEVVALSIGYGVGLLALRRWIPAHRDVAGRRTMLAAVLGPISLGALSRFTQGATLPSITVLSVGAGAFGALLLWLPALRPVKPPERSLEELEAAADAELARLGALPSPKLELVDRPQREKPPAESNQQVA